MGEIGYNVRCFAVIEYVVYICIIKNCCSRSWNTGRPSDSLSETILKKSQMVGISELRVDSGFGG
jgi:hypothetical protein